jgi:hypothetical protein
VADLPKHASSWHKYVIMRSTLLSASSSFCYVHKLLCAVAYLSCAETHWMSVASCTVHRSGCSSS